MRAPLRAIAEVVLDDLSGEVHPPDDPHRDRLHIRE
jgi:hypothetical protein